MGLNEWLNETIQSNVGAEVQQKRTARMIERRRFGSWILLNGKAADSKWGRGGRTLSERKQHEQGLEVKANTSGDQKGDGPAWSQSLLEETAADKVG